MISQKESSRHSCNVCRAELVDENWLPYLKLRSNYICRGCFKLQCKKKYFENSDLLNRQNLRYKMRRSAVVQSYGDCCKNCGEDRYELLTIFSVVDERVPKLIDHLYDSKINEKKYLVLCYNCHAGNTVKTEKYLKNKTSVIFNYGGWCCDCKEDRVDRLCIDKIDIGHGTGIAFYRYLIKNNYPDLDLQVICYNCKRARTISYETREPEHHTEP